MLDLDNDGRIDRSEYNAGFDVLDADHDNRISAEEFGAVSCAPFHLLDTDSNDSNNDSNNDNDNNNI